MQMRLRNVLIAAGSVLTLGTAGAWQSAYAEPETHGAPAKAAAPARPEPSAKPKTVTPAKDAHGHDAPADAAGEDDPANDEHDAAHAPAGQPGKPAAGKTAEPTPRKPLFGDKAKEKEKEKAAAPTDEGVTADRALEMLKEGNLRWVSGDVKNPNIDSTRRELVADKGQKPFATVLTCSDSRVPIERVFDRGVGEIFTVRVAGNVSGGAAETGTIEYGVEHLHTPLLVVMGHTKCGAVAAAAAGTPLHGKVAELVANIAPAVERAKLSAPNADPNALAAAAVKENVWQSIFDLYRSSDELRQEAKEGKVRVIGAIYDISTGKVEWLGEHPWQSQILDALQVKTATAPHESE